MKLILLCLFILSACSSVKKKDPVEDKNVIKSMAGCYEVKFKFAETFPLGKGYAVKKPYYSGGTELIVVDEEVKGRIELQHILIVGHGKNLAPLKHWRQEWQYNPSELLSFKGGSTWEKTAIHDSQGRWLQRVLQVDDSPRYECAARWVDTGDSRFWECQSWDPLPRREYTRRNDYQVIERMNRHRITPYGWIHEQDSLKLKLTAEGPVAIVKERGENTYRRIDDSHCKLAQDWWEAHRNTWKSIRKAWEEVRKNEKISLKFKDEEGSLWPKLFELDDIATREKWTEKEIKEKSLSIIRSYL